MEPVYGAFRSIPNKSQLAELNHDADPILVPTGSSRFFLLDYFSQSWTAPRREFGRLKLQQKKNSLEGLKPKVTGT